MSDTFGVGACCVLGVMAGEERHAERARLGRESTSTVCEDEHEDEDEDEDEDEAVCEFAAPARLRPRNVAVTPAVLLGDSPHPLFAFAAVVADRVDDADWTGVAE